MNGQRFINNCDMTWSSLLIHGNLFIDGNVLSLLGMCVIRGPQTLSSILDRDSPWNKPSIFGNPHLWKPPYTVIIHSIWMSQGSYRPGVYHGISIFEAVISPPSRGNFEGPSCVSAIVFWNGLRLTLTSGKFNVAMENLNLSLVNHLFLSHRIHAWYIC